MSNLWSTNHPRNFWQCQSDTSDEVWQKAVVEALPALKLNGVQPDIDSILALTLGEARFGPGHWQLSLPKRAYYFLKPFIPRAFIQILRRLYHHSSQSVTEPHWPVDARYASFLWEIFAHVLQASPEQQLIIKALWPNNQRFSFVLTHDVETKTGLEFVRNVADLEEEFGFRSSFNFVPERYSLDSNLMDELRSRGFEIGIHGLKHDGKLFSSRNEFERRAKKINHYLQELNAVGFRTPLTHRNPEWMQAINLDYDLSFFDTDPFEPIPGGAMSIWPFFIGRFVELPYTLVQDYSLTNVLGEETPKFWLEKVEFIRQYHGMALVNSHPDYLKDSSCYNVYAEFLRSMQEMNDYWHALPHEVSKWWRDRSEEKTTYLGQVSYNGAKVEIVPYVQNQ